MKINISLSLSVKNCYLKSLWSTICVQVPLIYFFRYINTFDFNTYDYIFLYKKSREEVKLVCAWTRRVEIEWRSWTLKWQNFSTFAEGNSSLHLSQIASSLIIMSIRCNVRETFDILLRLPLLIKVLRAINRLRHLWQSRLMWKIIGVKAIDRKEGESQRI